MANASASGGSSVDCAEQHPSFEYLFNTNNRRPFPSNEAQRLRWSLDGPLTNALSVMKEPYHDPDTGAPEPYFGSDGSLHAVSQAPCTDPKISSVTVTVTQLEDWEDLWVELHRGHSAPLDRSGSDDEDDYDDFPLTCCGEARPRPKDTSLVVRASGQFLTVHDYVSAVHPWLMAKRDDILGALGVLDDQPRSLRPGERLMVLVNLVASLSVTNEDEWFEARSKEHYLKFLKPALAKPTDVPAGRHWVNPSKEDKGPPYSETNLPPGYRGWWPAGHVYDGPWPPVYTGTGRVI